MTGIPPPPPVPGGPPPASWGPPPASATDRVRVAWQRRHDSDYVFHFWSALGWTILTCGIFGFYVTYQLLRRSRDHNLRRLELLDAATAFAWERAESQGVAEELRPGFERVAGNLATLRQQTTQFRDPAVWTVLDVLGTYLTGIGGLVVTAVYYSLLDGDLDVHDRAEGAAEADLSVIYGRLGAPLAPPDAGRLKGRHNYAGRVVATILTCGIYALWWTYDVMTDLNRHFEHNWRWEDDLAASVQQLAAAA
jgi:hypothetical protein